MQTVVYQFCASHSAPIENEWLVDNVTCYTAANFRSFACSLELKPVTTPVHSPQSNDKALTAVSLTLGPQSAT
jgi:putative transposase